MNTTGGITETLIFARNARKEATGVSSGQQDLSRYSGFSDESLMKVYQGGDASAFTVLYQRHSARVYGYLKGKLRDRAQVDDIFQAVFLKLHHSRARYDHSFPFAPWLYTVCRSVLLDHLRARARNLEDPAEQEYLEGVSAKSAEHSSSEGGSSERTLPELSELPEDQRLALKLRYQQELSFAEIANALQTSPANARQIVSRAVRRLKSTFAKGGTHVDN